VSSVLNARPDSRSGSSSAGSPIYVIATTVAATREAIATASALAEPLDARIHVLAARSLPTEWSLEQQSAPVHAFAREIKHLVEGSTSRIDVLPCVCRRLTDVTQLLPPGALVIMAAASHRWWPTREQRLAHDLNGLGHRVMFIHTSDDAPAALAG
jgi:hypothetical protein